MVYKRSMEGGKNNLEEELAEKQPEIIEQSVEVAETEPLIVENMDIDDIDMEGQHEEIMVSLEKLYEKRNNELERIFGNTEKEVDISGVGVGRIKKGAVQTGYNLRRGLSESQRITEDKIKKLEKAALAVPGDMEAEAEKSFELEKEIPEDIRDYKEEASELVEKLDSSRKNFVKKFIENSVNEVADHFRDILAEAVNGPNAKEIINLKTRKEIELAARRFIERGDKPDFGFEASLEVSSYKISEGEEETEKKYITGYTIKMGGYEKKVRASDKPMGKSLAGQSIREELKDAKARGKDVVKTRER